MSLMKMFVGEKVCHILKKITRNAHATAYLVKSQTKLDNQYTERGVPQISCIVLVPDTLFLKITSKIVRLFGLQSSL